MGFSSDCAVGKTHGKHPTQKPLPLLVRLILMATNENSVVCDPFAGSAASGIAANLLGRNFIGIEKESIDFSVVTNQYNNNDWLGCGGKISQNDILF